MKTYCNDELSILKMMQRDYQQKSLREDLAREKAESYKEGQKDLTHSQAKLLREMLEEKFGNVSENVNEHIAKASFEQLGNAIKKVYFIQDQKEIIQYLIS